MNEKKKVTVRELVNKYQENSERINTIAEACEKEQRERTEQETTEYNALVRENNVLQMKMQAAAAEALGKDVKAVDTDAMLREYLLSEDNARKVTIAMMREVTPQTSAALAETGIIPITQQELLGPIRKGLIWDKVGLTIRSGLAGKLRWPMHGKAVAAFADEAERLTDSKIDFDKLETDGKRMGIAIPVTRTELEDSEGIVDSVIKDEAPAAIIDLINAALFCTTASYTNKDGKAAVRKVYGPFVEAYKKAKQFAGAVPTRSELLAMKAQVAAAVDLKAPCWVMTETMKAALQDVKVDAGSGRFVCENDMILGYPVFCTNEIGEGNVGFGDWSYQAAGFFGQMNFVADPYTLLRQDSVDFVLNSRFGTVTLRKEAFVVGKANAGA